MTTSETPRFYVAGGALPRDAPSYVRRQADDALYTELLQGEFCYVLTARQMGKSSLMVRTATRLRAEGCAVAIVDLSALGNHLTIEQWYDGVTGQIGRGLKLTATLDAFWQERARLSPLQRWLEALQDVVLKERAGRVVLFIDEIDAVLSLPFSVDEFFAAIRQCYNRRAEFPEFARLTFCLLGVAAPTELIANVRVTPFNIGQRIQLNDFTPEEATVLESGLGADEIVSEALLQRVLHWTGGHPCLTQRLCLAVANEGSARSLEGVDRLCRERFLANGAERRDDNLVFVRDRLLRSDADRASLLTLYERIVMGRRVADDAGDPLVGLLKLSGLVRSADGILQVRNRIYAHVFDRAWVREHMPDAELRRQRMAYRAGVLRAAAVAAVALAIVGSLAFVAITQARHAGAEAARADRERNRAESLLYAADMGLAQQAYQQGAYGRAAQLLEAHMPGAGDRIDRRGFEWRYLWGLMHQDRQTFTHTGASIVSSTAFSPDGKTLASAGEDGTIKLWDYSKWRERATLHGPTKGIYALAFSPDGRLLASANLNKTVTVWNMATGDMQPPLPHRGLVYSVAFSPDGRWLSTGDEKGNVTLWDVASCREVASIRQDGGPVYAIAFSRDGRWLASGDGDPANEHVNLWLAPFRVSPESKRLLAFAHGGSIFSLAFSPWSEILAVGRGNGDVEIWNIRTQRKLTVLTGRRAEVNGLAFSPDGRMLASGSWDGTVRLWNTASWKPLGPPLIGHTNRVTSVSFSPDGRWLASSGGKEVKVWDYLHREQNPLYLAAFPINNRSVINRQRFDYPYHSLMFSPTGALCQFVFARANRSLLVWNIKARSAMMRYPMPDRASAAILSHDGRMVAFGTFEGAVLVQSVASGQPVQRLLAATANADSVTALAFSSDDRMLAVSSGDPATATVWDVASGRRKTTFQHTNSAMGVAFSPDGAMLAAANWQGRVYLRDLTTGRPLDPWWAHAKPVNDVAFSPDGRTLATCGDDGTVKLWNLATRREMVTLADPGAPVISVAFSPDGSKLAALSHDAHHHFQAWIWEAKP
jgi:WD40 repeat protein